jgi:arginyl-tRNA synthetase
VDRWERFKFERMFYVVAAQQDLHFSQLFKMLSLLGHEWASRCEHVSFGMVRGMATRKGNAVFLESILDEAHETMHEVMRKNEERYAQLDNPDAVADAVGMSAVIVQDMSARRIKVCPHRSRVQQRPPPTHTDAVVVGGAPRTIRLISSA